MKNYRFYFSEIDSTESFSCLGTSLGGKAVNNLIHLSPENGHGAIRKVDFEKGLHLRSWDFNLTQSFILQRISRRGPEPGKAFSIIYVLCNDAVILHSTVLRKEIKLQGSMNVLLIPNNIDINFLLCPGTEIKAVDISISAEWMKSQFNDADPLFQTFLDKIKNNAKPVLFVETGTSMEYRTAMDLHAHSFSGAKGTLYVKAKALSLISDFLNRFTQNPSELLEGNILHQEKMLMVEKILEEHFEKDLPSIELIAQQTALSESTLKRHFKLMFGKSIYEYYLEKKMDYAKRLLLEKPLTVKEVAYRLGYEKTSNFIHIFKKIHSYSPGHLKKNTAF